MQSTVSCCHSKAIHQTPQQWHYYKLLVLWFKWNAHEWTSLPTKRIPYYWNAYLLKYKILHKAGWCGTHVEPCRHSFLVKIPHATICCIVNADHNVMDLSIIVKRWTGFTFFLCRLHSNILHPFCHLQGVGADPHLAFALPHDAKQMKEKAEEPSLQLLNEEMSIRIGRAGTLSGKPPFMYPHQPLKSVLRF